MKKERTLQGLSSRLRECIKDKGFVTESEFAKAARITPTTLSNYLNDVSSPHAGMIAHFSKLLGVSTDYLLGVTDLKAPSLTAAEADGKVNGKVNGKVDHPGKTNGTKNSSSASDEGQLVVSSRNRDKTMHLSDKPPLVVVVDTKGDERISLVSSQAAAGYPQLYLEPEYISELPTFAIPTPDFRTGTFRCFEVRGDSMATTIKPGEWVIGRFVDNWPQNIKNGYIYVVVTAEAILVKRVLNRVMERQTVVLQSDNEDYETIELSALDVLELWDIKASLRFKFPSSTRFNALRKIRALEADYAHLRQEVTELKKNGKKGH